MKARFGAALGLSCFFAGVVAIAAPGVSADDGDDAKCVVEKDRSGGVVLLIDQSSSLKGQSLESVGEAIEAVADTLDFADEEKEVDIKLGIISFGEVATVERPLSKYRAGDDISGIADELSSGDDLEGFTDYLVGLSAADEMFKNDTSIDCKLLLWFTDGVFDRGPNDVGVNSAEDRDEANLLLEEVCGNSPLASQISDRQIQSFAVLLQPDPRRWDRWFEAYPQLEVGLSAMQAITGAREIKDLPIDGYSVLEQCSGLIDTVELKGDVLVGSSDLKAVFASIIEGWIGGTGECPIGVPIGAEVKHPADGFVPGVFIQRLRIMEWEGSLGKVFAVHPSLDSPIELRLDPETGTIGRDQIKDLPGGWQLLLTNSGNENLVACVKSNSARDSGAIVAVTANTETVDLLAEEPFTLSVSAESWEKAFDGAAPTGVIESWAIESRYFEDTPFVSDPNTPVEVTLTARPDGDELREVTLVIRPQGSDEEIRRRGKLESPIRVATNDNAPYMSCDPAAGSEEVFGGFFAIGGAGEEVDESLYSVSGSCTIFPPTAPADGTMVVSASHVMEYGDEVPWELVDVSGTVLSVPFELAVGDSPVTVHFATQNPLEVREWQSKGAVTLNAKWSSYPIQSFEATLSYSAELLIPADIGEALEFALLLVILSVLLSLGLLRLLNFLLIRIPPPGDFYYLTFPFTASSEPGFGVNWQPQGEGFESDLRPVVSNAPGKVLKAGQLEVRRSLGPLWKPFEMPSASLSGFRFVRSSPAGRRPRSAPVSFAQLSVVGTDGVVNPQTREFEGHIVLLFPRRFEIDSSQTTREIDRVMKSVVTEIEDSAANAKEQSSGGGKGVPGRRGKGPDSDDPKPTGGSREGEGPGGPPQPPKRPGAPERQTRPPAPPSGGAGGGSSPPPGRETPPPPPRRT